jgi:hypothetical protein
LQSSSQNISSQEFLAYLDLGLYNSLLAMCSIGKIYSFQHYSLYGFIRKNNTNYFNNYDLCPAVDEVLDTTVNAAFAAKNFV